MRELNGTVMYLLYAKNKTEKNGIQEGEQEE